MYPKFTFGDEEQIRVLKVLLAGEGNSGKTSLVRRFTIGDFDKKRAHTIGMEFHSKIINHRSGKIKLDIWDLAGQPQFHYLRVEFYPGSLATALVFDLSSQDSFLELKKWYQEIKNAEPNQKFLVIGNKNDLRRKIDKKIAKRFASSINAPYLETSAKKRHQVNKMFKYLVALAISE